MFSNGIERTESTGPLEPKQVGQVKRTDASDQSKPSQAGKSAQAMDRASISADAAEVARYREMAELHREAYGPEDRSAKLDEVRARIASGYYENPEVVDELAGKMTDESISAPAGSNNMDAIRSRSESGFYDRAEVIDKTAENIVKTILPGLSEE